MYEYGSAANPEMAPIPVLVHPPTLHQSGPTRVVPFDIDDYLEIDGQCTSPNLMASFLRVEVGTNLGTKAIASSQAFYVIRGTGVGIPAPLLGTLYPKPTPQTLDTKP